MANNATKSTHNTAFHVLGLFVFLALIHGAGATEFKVGGSNGWTVPMYPKALTYNQWAETKRFQIGDSLLFVYQVGKDSVLQVNSEDYTNCHIATPIKSFKDGKTSFKFNKSGAYFFISGNQENCLKNERMIVAVMADRGNRPSNSNPPGENSYPPPPGYGENNPYFIPPGEEHGSPPGKGASSKVGNSMGFIGAFFGSTLLFVL